MASKEFDDIWAMAQKESADRGHFYIGVEHIFVALTKLQGGVTASTLEDQGLAPRFVRYMIRQEVGQGDHRRFWPGFRETPRLHVVLRVARELADGEGRETPVERDLFLAILREGESLPYRILSKMDIDLDRLEVEAANWSAQRRPEPPPVPVEVHKTIDPLLDEMEMMVLRQMFRGYGRLLIERQLEGGFTHARVLVASPQRVDGNMDASVVVKLDERQTILYEKMRYDSFVRDTLPPATAHVLGSPVVPDQSTMGGLKYTFLRNAGEDRPIDLLDYAREYGPQAASDLLWHGLYEVFGTTWWKQHHDYAFGAWQEYEMVLPAALVVEVTPGLGAPTRRLTPQGQWSRRGRFAPGEVVMLEGFTVADFYPARAGIQLVAGGGSEALSKTSKVEVRGIRPSREFYRGAVIGQLVGRVISTRDELLYESALALDPPFDLNAERLPEHSSLSAPLPNPLKRYANVLQRPVAGSLSIIHGDLHLHNILVGPGGNAWLIDFAETREGHTLYDWAVLETSLLTEVVAPAIGSDAWEDIWPVIGMLAEIGMSQQPPRGRLPVAEALHPVATVRQIVGECLANPNDWAEYYVALALCLMRGLRWQTISVRGRRLLFLAAALAMSAAGGRDGSLHTSRDIDATDVNVMLTDITNERNLPGGSDAPSTSSGESFDDSASFPPARPQRPRE